MEHEWIDALNQRKSLRALIIDYLGHFKLHLSEIDELINIQGKETRIMNHQNRSWFYF
jgi:hypothetical protein